MIVSSCSPTWLVVGLGNPGAKYEQTPHNVGYLAVDHCDPVWKSVFGAKAFLACQQWGEHTVGLVRSKTYMNDSGVPIARLCKKFGIAPDHVIVIHDELDIAPGTVRVKLGGSENGHNGLKSTTECLGTRDYYRIRMGIGRPDPGATVIDHVLGSINFDVTDMVETAVEAAHCLISEGLATTQHRIHSK